MKLPERYKPIGPLLKGGMSSVHQCMDSVLERKVAIKLVSPTTDSRRMRDEISALLKLRSKHVVQVYDVLALPGNQLAIVQEFVEGTGLDGKQSPLRTAAAFYQQLWQIASGIADIHSAGLIHRDIKPDNMRRDGEGVIKIFDFGLARSEGTDAKTKGFVGTRGFAAPELYTPSGGFTQAVDTYAFGICALYFTAGRLPPDLIATPPVPRGRSYFSAMPLGISPEVVAVMDACLAVDPGDRPSMLDVRDALARRLLAGKHQALVAFDDKQIYLNSSTPSVKFKVDGLGEVEVRYNRLAFILQSMTGEIFINNKRLATGTVLPGSCVIAFGAPERRAARKYVTVDVSHPEVVL